VTHIAVGGLVFFDILVIFPSGPTGPPTHYGAREDASPLACVREFGCCFVCLQVRPGMVREYAHALLSP
jgi:hypothetical protein